MNPNNRSELHQAFAARDQAIEDLKTAATRLRTAARATGLGPTDLSVELDISISSAADILRAAKEGKLRVRPSRAARKVATVTPLRLVEGAESSDVDDAPRAVGATF